MSNASEILSALSGRVKKTFDDNRTILGFDEWFEILLDRPTSNLRNAAQYVQDAFDHFGVDTLDLPQGEVKRYKLFDAPWSNGEGRVAGQEEVQREIYRLVSNFVREGRISRLILLHGPNGSAKSSIVRCIQSALEHYSHTPEGALYSYAWIFPSENIVKGRLGFDAPSHQEQKKNDTYAYLNAEQIDARLPCELRDHPIFLVPVKERQSVFDQLKEEGKIPDDFVFSRYILEGDLSPRDRAIYEALLVANDGDHREVLRHIQVQRFYVSVKYGRGVTTVEPQMHVDAEARQLTADSSITNLPRPLQTVPLYELHGSLVAANRGLLEFSDLLKRPVEAFKYLLTTSEEASASLPMFKIHLDEVLMASSNEKQLEGFKEYPDWNSFKARIELVRVPYLRRFSDEVQIYNSQITPASLDKPIAPHVIEAASLWAILTRLKWPDPEHFPEEIRDTIRRIKPLEKVWLYDNGDAPPWTTATQARDLRKVIGEIFDEYKGVLYYEGQLGASAREIRTMILNAAHRPAYRCLTPLPVFDELTDLVGNKSLYEFLRQDPRNGYHDNAKFVDTVRDWWLDLLDEELRTSMGLVEEARHQELFGKYVLHVSSLLKKEKILDKVTDQYVEPDEDLMRDVEATILAENEDRTEFRKSIIGRIGAWGLDHAGQTPNYRDLFKTYVDKMEQEYFHKQSKVITKNLTSLLEYVREDEPQLEEEDLAVAKRTAETMEQRYHYEPLCTEECAAYLLRSRYADSDS